jgi:hypothetical protein
MSNTPPPQTLSSLVAPEPGAQGSNITAARVRGTQQVVPRGQPHCLQILIISTTHTMTLSVFKLLDSTARPASPPHPTPPQPPLLPQSARQTSTFCTHHEW